MKQESEFLFLELKNGIQYYTNTKQIGFIKEEEGTKLSALTLRGSKEYPKWWALQQFCIFTSINLYNFGWLLFLNHVICKQSV